MLGEPDLNRLAELYKLYIFEMIPKEQRTPGKVGWWRNLQQGKQVPSAFARGFLLTGDVIMLSVAVWIGITTHAQGITIAGLEILFVGACALLLVSRRFKRFLSVVGAYLAVVGLGIILNLVFPGMWGVVLLYALCVNVFYRFPPGWSLPLAGVCILVVWMLTDLALLSRADLSFVMPVTASTYVLIALAGRLLLNEQISWVRWTGVVVITLGAALVGKTPVRTTEPQPEHLR